jgi:hypothetical protein
MRKIPIEAYRIVAGIFLIPLVVFIDDIGEYHWFWPCDRLAVGVVILIGAIGVVLLAPHTRTAARRRKKDHEAVKKMEAYLNDGKQP